MFSCCIFIFNCNSCRNKTNRKIIEYNGNDDAFHKSSYVDFEGEYVKNFFVLLFCLLFLCSCVADEPTETLEKPLSENPIKAVWIYYNELSMISENGGSEKSFRSKTDRIFDNCKLLGINTAFVQIRPFSDSFYPSDIFPWSKYLTGEQGKDVGYDPLKIMIESSEERGIEFHAWINPFRISSKNDLSELSDDNPVFDYIDSDLVFRFKKGIYFNPSSLEIHKLIFDGVKEIIKKYDVDGIHIDDYFYPTKDESIDKTQYQEYIDNGGNMHLNEWRLFVINSFVSGLYQCVKSINKEITVSVSPAGNITNNYSALYADVNLWCSQPGYCDMIIPQLYFGYDNENLPFDKAFSQWEKMNINPEIKLVCGIPVYKAVDGETEEPLTTDTITNQVRQVLESDKYDGYSLFSYSSLVELSSDFINN